MSEISAITFVLQRYQGIFSQRVNFHKLEVVFSAHVSNPLKTSLSCALGVRLVGNHHLD